MEVGCWIGRSSRAPAWDLLLRHRTTRAFIDILNSDSPNGNVIMKTQAISMVRTHHTMLLLRSLHHQFQIRGVCVVDHKSARKLNGGEEPTPSAGEGYELESSTGIKQPTQCCGKVA